MPLNFDGCWAKMARAKRHRDTLARYIRKTAAVEANRPRLSIKFDAGSRNHIVWVSLMPNLQPFMRTSSVIAGDVLHNLRSALDYLAFQLAFKNTGGNISDPRRIQFPIEDSPETFAVRCTDRGRRGYIADLHADDQAIIERYQPYKRRHGEISPLWVSTNPISIQHQFIHHLATLRDWNDADKHRLLTNVKFSPASILVSEPILAAILRDYAELSIDQWGTLVLNRIELGAELFWAPLPDAPRTDVEVAGYLTPHVSLADGRALIDTIDKVAATVVQILGEFCPPPAAL